MPLDLTELDKDIKNAGISIADTVETHDDRGKADGSQTLKLITMGDIKEYEPDPTLYLVGDGHIIRGKDRIHLIAGYAGVGKSRATSYLAYCGATGKKWFDYDIKNRFKTLFIQTENGM